MKVSQFWKDQPRSWKIQAAVMLLCPLVALTGFIFVGLPQLQPKPLETASPDLYSKLQQAIPATEVSIANAQTVTDTVAGKDAKPADTALSAAGQAFGNTWLKVSDPTVKAIADEIIDCQSLIALGKTLMDPAQTLVGMTGQRDDTVTPRIIELSDADDTTKNLADCSHDLMDLSTAAKTALDEAKTTASDTQASTDNKTARDTLAAAIATAQATLDGSAGKVSDDVVRQGLQASIDAAKTASENTTVSTDWEKIDTDTAAVTQASTDLTAANQAVTDAQTAWQAVEDARIAAEQAAAQAAAQKSRAQSSSGTGSRTPSRTGGSSNSSSSSNTGSSSGTSSSGSSDTPVNPDPIHNGYDPKWFGCGKYVCTAQAGGYDMISYFLAEGWTPETAEAAFWAEYGE